MKYRLAYVMTLGVWFLLVWLVWGAYAHMTVQMP